MRRFIAFVLPLLFSANAFAALPAGAKWQIWSTATASNVNGGFFNPARAGTDLSQNDNAAYNFTNLASSNANTNPCVVTSASHNFVTADEGNGLNLTAAGSNFTVGRYEIVSTSGNAATLDRACGTAASASGGTFYVGGALPTIDDATLENGVAGNIWYVKGGAGPITYTVSGTVSLAANGTATLPIRIIGFSASNTDAPTGATRPIIDAGANVFTVGTNYSVEYAVFTGSGTATFTSGTGVNRTLFSKYINTSTTASRTALNSAGTYTVLGSEFISIRGIGYQVPANGGGIVSASYFHDSNQGVNIGSTGSPIAFTDCIFESNVTSAITTSNPSAVSIVSSTLYGSEAKIGTGLSLGATATGISVINSIFYGFVTGINNSNTTATDFDAYNNMYNNTTPVSGWTQGAGATAINPGFASISQITGTGATTESGGVLRKTGAFTSSLIVDGSTYVHVQSGTGITAGEYLVQSHDADTITLSPAIAANATADKVFSVNVGHNFAISYQLNGLGFPGLIPGSASTGYMSQGAVQRRSGFPAKWW